MVLVWEKGRMMVGLGRERGRGLLLGLDPQAELRWVGLALLPEGVLSWEDSRPCLMATWAGGHVQRHPACTATNMATQIPVQPEPFDTPPFQQPSSSGRSLGEQPAWRQRRLE